MCAFEITPPSSHVWSVKSNFTSKTTPSRNVPLLSHSVVNVQVTTCPLQHFGVFWLCICWVWWGKPRNSISLHSVAAPLGTWLHRSKSSLDWQLKVTNLLLWQEGSWQWANWTVELSLSRNHNFDYIASLLVVLLLISHIGPLSWAAIMAVGTEIVSVGLRYRIWWLW